MKEELEKKEREKQEELEKKEKEKQDFATLLINGLKFVRAE